MANNYLLFSEEIGDLTYEEADWLKDALSNKSPSELTDYSWCPPFEYAFEPNGKALWIYSEESGDLEFLAKLIQSFLFKFRPNQFFALTWAETCSKPRLGEFGGGSVFITSIEIKWAHTHNWIDTQIVEFNENAEYRATK